MIGYSLPSAAPLKLYETLKPFPVVSSTENWISSGVSEVTLMDMAISLTPAPKSLFSTLSFQVPNIMP